MNTIGRIAGRRVRSLTSLSLIKPNQQLLCSLSICPNYYRTTSARVPTPAFSQSFPRGIHSSAPLCGTIHTSRLPALGDAITSGDLNEWTVEVGDYVEEDQAIAIIDTDKVAVEVPATVSGFLRKKYVTEPGETVNVGQEIADIEEAPAPAGKKSSATQPASSPSETKPTVSEESASVAETTGERVPLIKFTHGKRPPRSSNSGSEGSVEQDTEADSGQVPVYDFLDMPELYGRLPPMSEEEMERMILGGADP